MKNLNPKLVVIICILLLLPGLAYFTLRITLPGDTSQPVVDFLSLTPGGLTVRPVTSVPGGLRSGDIVTAIQGRPVDQTILDLFSPQNPSGNSGKIRYTVLRGGQTLQVDASLSTFTLAQAIRSNWSLYIYFLYLELVSLLLFILRPRLAAARLFFLVSTVLVSSGLVFFNGLRIDDLLNPWLVLLFLWGSVGIYGVLLAGLVHLSLVFPKPHPLLARHPRWLLLIYLGAWLPMLVYLAARWASSGSPAAHLAMALQGTSFMSAVYFPLVLLATASNYRLGTAREKRQIRWNLWSLMISLVPYLAFSVVPSLVGINMQIATSFLGILWCSVPTSFAIAVLHERLFDIDLIIRRTLIYSTLTVTLGAVYFASIVLLQGFFQALTGHQQPIATVLSTLIIAALFTPLRRRIQHDIDRRFYRRKYDAEKMLKTFGRQLRNEVELEKISEDLLAVVEETVEPENLSLWVWKSKTAQPSLGGRALEESARSEY